MMRVGMILSLVIMAAVNSMAQTPEVASKEIMSALKTRVDMQRESFFSDGQFPNVAQSLELTLSFDMHQYERVTDLGWMYGSMEMPDKEIALYERFRKAFPQDPEASFPSADFYFRKREYEKIPPILEPSLKLPTKPHANSYRILANAYDRLQRYKDSLRIWDQYLEINPNDPAAIRNRNKVRDLAKDGG